MLFGARSPKLKRARRITGLYESLRTEIRESSLVMWRFYKATRPLPGFNVDEPTGTLPYSAELFATVRGTGRFLEDVRISLGGAEIRFQLQAEEGGGGFEHRIINHRDPEVAP